MSMWRKTLVYLGLVEEPDEYDEMPERFEEQARAARPAMHDSTGPIDVVRPEGAPEPGRRPTADEPRLRPVHDLTEPVSLADEGRPRGRGEQRERRRGATPREGRRAARAGGAGEDDNVRELRGEEGRGGAMPAGLGRRVAVLAVTDYESGAREVGQRYRQSVPVVFDLTDAPSSDRRRVLDFVAGVTFALHGEMLKVGPRSFLIVPSGGEVSDAEWERLAGLGYRP